MSLTPRVEILPTPNPDAQMFRVAEVLVPTGTYEYTSHEKARRAPLALALLEHAGVDLVLIAPRFVTVRKAPAADWAVLGPAVAASIDAFLETGEMAVLDEAAAASGPTGANAAIEARILQLLDEEIRPAVANDGGDVTYMGFDEGVVKLKLIGSCGTCPSSLTTLKMGIERLLTEEIPEVRSVEQVA